MKYNEFQIKYRLSRLKGGYITQNNHVDESNHWCVVCENE